MAQHDFLAAFHGSISRTASIPSRINPKSRKILVRSEEAQTVGDKPILILEADAMTRNASVSMERFVLPQMRNREITTQMQQSVYTSSRIRTESGRLP